MNFLGKFKAVIDEKNRLVIPAKWRSILGIDVVISKGFDGCLDIRGADEFKSHADKFIWNNTNQRNSRLLLRQILANSCDLTLDKASRILIPANMLKMANIEKEVYLLGLGTYVEIWDVAKYDLYDQEASAMLEKISEETLDPNSVSEDYEK